MARETSPETDFTGIIADVKQAEKILNERIHDLTARHKHKVEVELIPISAIGAAESFRIKIKVFKEVT